MKNRVNGEGETATIPDQKEAPATHMLVSLALFEQLLGVLRAQPWEDVNSIMQQLMKSRAVHAE